MASLSGLPGLEIFTVLLWVTGCTCQQAECLFEDSLQRVIQHHVLPKLAAKDLAALACSCSKLLTLVYDAPPAVWEVAAKQCLPPTHPLPHLCSRAAVQQALWSFIGARRNACAGQYRICSIRAASALFSTGGSHVAALTPHALTIFDAQNSQIAVQMDGLQFADTAQPFQWSSSGTSAALILARGCGSSLWYIARGNLLDQAVRHQGLAGMRHIWLPHEYCRDDCTPRLSPDLSKVFIACMQADKGAPGGLVQLVVLDADTQDLLWSFSTQTLLTLSWHPRGDAILFSTHEANPEAGRGTFAARIFDVATCSTMLCPFTALDVAPDDCCALDEGCVVDASPDGVHLSRQCIEVEGATVTDLLHLKDRTCTQPPLTCLFDTVVWSWDSSKFATFSGNSFEDPASQLCVCTSQGALVASRPLLTDQVVLLDHPAVSWSPDDMLLAVATRQGSVCMLSTSQGLAFVSEIVIADFVSCKDHQLITQLSWSPSYSNLAVVHFTPPQRKDSPKDDGHSLCLISFALA